MNFKDAVLPQADKFQYITNKLQRSLAAEEKDLALSDRVKNSLSDRSRTWSHLNGLVKQEACNSMELIIWIIQALQLPFLSAESVLCLVVIVFIWGEKMNFSQILNNKIITPLRFPPKLANYIANSNKQLFLIGLTKSAFCYNAR